MHGRVAATRMWRSFRWGRTLELFVLDTRGERRPSTRHTPHAEYLSPAQFAWLTDGLARSDAAFKFVRWITTPQRAAQWGIDTGYVAVRADAWETPAMKQYVAGFPPAAVARDQLPFAKAELSTHDNQRVTQALNDGLQAALTGTKTPEQALKDAQREADRLLRPYKK